MPPNFSKDHQGSNNTLVVLTTLLGYRRRSRSLYNVVTAFVWCISGDAILGWSCTKNFGVAKRQRGEGRGKKEKNVGFCPLQIIVLLKNGSIRFYPFFVGFKVGSNDKFANSRQLSLIGQNYGTLRMKCVLGETLRSNWSTTQTLRMKSAFSPKYSGPTRRCTRNEKSLSHSEDARR